MIIIDESLLIGEGAERHCYVHPKDSGLCIKITKKDIKGRLEQSIVEHDYFYKLKKRNIKLSHLPKCYGWIDTNMGDGLVYERVFSYKNKNVSLTLKEAFRRKLVDINETNHLLNELYDFISKNNITISDLSMSNLVIKLDGKRKLYLVDGVGGRNFDYKYKIRNILPIPFYSKVKLKQQQREINKWLNIEARNL
ncbi:hypothetical protein C7I36_09000 [Zobellella taiwanensis]|uniref:PhoP regulatory network protein YrbL n=1 Tax=Zobellella taiwanensis TaxID=347535 RepID=A0A2P7QXV3_9GAMM|nr:YrbL family protein [Zobellella taiwanensis]PSJ42794.1 hypothetical protein C7I36_09000 [Zobellella taiwanensis]